MKTSAVILAAVAAVSSIASSAMAVAITVPTVGTYAAGVGTAGNVASEVDAGAFTGQIGRGLFTTALSTAFAANLGGDVTFDTGFTNGSSYGEGSGNAITATFGTGSVNFYRTDVSGLASAPTPAFFQVQPNNNNSALTTSGGTATGGAAGAAGGGGYFGAQGNFGIGASGTQDASAGGGVNLGFSTGLASVGFSLVPRSADRLVTLTALLDNGMTLVSSQNTSNSNGNTATTPTGSATTSTGTTAVFYGFLAPAGRTIVGLRLNEQSNGFARFDDLAFILPTPSVASPEPASLGLLALGGIGLIRRRRA